MRTVHVLGITLVTTQLALFACATAQDQPGLASGGSTDSASGSSDLPTGGSGSPSGGSGVSGTTQTGGSGTGNTAFGGSNGMPAGGTSSAGSTGSAGSAGAHGGAGGASSGGAAGAGAAGKGGAAAGGAATGGGGGRGGTGSGGAASGGSSTGGTGASGCLVGWQGDAKCDTCSTQTQPDHQACSIVLKCYEDNSCSPSTCGQPDQKCGQNTLGMGTAAFPIALNVYMCRCP